MHIYIYVYIYAYNPISALLLSRKIYLLVNDLVNDSKDEKIKIFCLDEKVLKVRI